MVAEVLQMERPAKAYSCDACGSRDPHCKACAKAREAAEKYYQGNEKARQRNIKHRAIRNAPVENIEDFDSPQEYEEMKYMDMQGHYAPPPKGTEEAAKVRGFLFRARESKNAANLLWIKGVKPTKEMREAAKEAAGAWQAVAEHIAEYK